MLAEKLFLEAIGRVFDAAHSPNGVKCFARSGSYLVHLHFASLSLAQALLPSFVIAPPGNADLAIAFATAREVDLAHIIPHPPDESRILEHRDRYALWHRGELPVLYLLDRRSNRAVIWLSAGGAPPWLLSRPTLPIMHAFTINTAWVGAHSGAVGHQGRFLLLAGKGRTGKTTASLACARAGWDYAGDDFVFTHTVSGRVEPLYSSARLRVDMAEQFGDLLHASAAVSEDDGEVRHELRLGAHLKTGQIKGGTIAAILLPRRRDAVTPEFAPARRLDAFNALAKVTTTQLPGWPTEVSKKLTALIGLAPVFFVDTGRDPAAIPNAFTDFLTRV
jgi:hypothetical protein